MRVYFTHEARGAVDRVFLHQNVEARDRITVLEGAVDFDAVVVIDNGWVQLRRDDVLLNLPPTSVLLAQRLTPPEED